MTASERGMQLRCRDGHFEMVPFDVKGQDGGFWMWVACEFDGHQGGHWLAPDPIRAGLLHVTSTPYLWPSATEAYAARERWAAQQEQ